MSNENTPYKGSESPDKDQKKQDESLKKCHKLLDSKLNTEDFIYEVEKHAPIWDSSSQDYMNKKVKLNAWNDIMCKFISDFEERPLVEKNILMTLIQKKWKSIRSCYTRELLRLKGVKSGSAATRKSQYIYFDQLRFLATTVKKNTNASTLVEVEIVEQEENGNCSSLDSRPILHKAKKRTNNDEELIDILKKKITSKESKESSGTSDSTDEDKLFLLSMVSEIHKVPAERKLKLRADIISLVAAAQAPRQQGCQQMGYTGYPYHPLQGPSMQQYPMAGLVMQEPHHHFYQTRQKHNQDTNMHLQSLSRGSSVTSNEESDTQMSDTLLFD